MKPHKIQRHKVVRPLTCSIARPAITWTRYTVRSAYKHQVGQAPFDSYKRLILISGVILYSFR